MRMSGKILDLCRRGLSVSEFIEGLLGGAEKTSLLEPGHLDELGGLKPSCDEQWAALQEAHVEPLLFGTEQYPT